jgi:non-specific protein-tyrosine kinase
MSLRKALEKAQQIRAGAGFAQPGALQKETRPPRIVARVAATDWKPPVYDESNRVELNAEALRANRCVCIAPDAPELEYYKVLRTKLQHMTRSRGWKSVMITSPAEGEGKTLTSVNLALTFAKAFNQTVMLVDCDLRRPTVHQVLGLGNGKGLVDFLLEEQPLKDFILWPGVEQLTVIPGGRPVANSAELLGSARMKALVEELKARYDDRITLMDTGPVLVGADALALAAHADCFIMVLDEGRTGMRDVKKALAMLPQEKFLGFVLNRQKNPKGKSHYYY